MQLSNFIQRTLWICFLLFICTQSGCVFWQGIQPTQSIITASSQQDFGFVGRWQEFNPRRPDQVGETYDITQDPQTHEYHIPFDTDQFQVVARAIPLDQQQNVALVELELKDPHNKLPARRRILIVTRERDQLKLEYIEGEALVEVLVAEHVTAIIKDERITCAKSTELLRVIQKHHAKLIGEPQFYQRVKEQPQPAIDDQGCNTRHLLSDPSNITMKVNSQSPILIHNQNLITLNSRSLPTWPTRPQAPAPQPVTSGWQTRA